MSAGPAADPRRARLVEVRAIEELTPHMRRFVLGGDLDDFAAGTYADEYVKLTFPAPGADYAAPFDVAELRRRLPRELWPRTRSYTVRRWDFRARAELTVDVVTHSAGVAGPWAAAAQLGDRLQLVGPGGKYAPSPAADWHLLVGDACVIPAIAVALERLPEGAGAVVVIAVDGPEDEQPLPVRDGVEVRWLHGGDAGLAAAVAQLEFPAGQVDAFVHGEAGAVRALRRHLVVERGVGGEAMSLSGYWKRSRDDEGWREDKAEWNRLVLADEQPVA